VGVPLPRKLWRNQASETIDAQYRTVFVGGPGTAGHLPPELAGEPQQNNLRNAVRGQRIDSAVVLAEESAIIIGQRWRHPVMQMVKASVLYFTLVFGAGFVLGTIRTLWVVPRVGARTAELSFRSHDTGLLNLDGVLSAQRSTGNSNPCRDEDAHDGAATVR
jgi:hypothetical protein